MKTVALQMTTKLEDNSAKVGMKLNAKKCDIYIYMKVNSNNKASLRVRNSEAKEVDRFTYLGANVTKDDDGTADIRKRIAMTNASFRRLDDNI